MKNLNGKKGKESEDRESEASINKFVKRLETENAEIRAEMEVSKLSALESVNTCLEDYIAAENRRIIELQEEMLQVEEAKKAIEITDKGLHRMGKQTKVVLLNVGVLKTILMLWLKYEYHDEAKIDVSLWILIPHLIAQLSKLLPPKAMKKSHNIIAEHKIYRHSIIQEINEFTEDRLLLMVLKDFTEQIRVKITGKCLFFRQTRTLVLILSVVNLLVKRSFGLIQVELEEKDKSLHEDM
ncbi:hypothetical protein L6452_25416 [Arctium lappa]|uniref:Uncharacterized protein n=1 Tax=Arctium lappa TaxID=4217 RepID=A0ACB9AAB9_ARCLA|nr:hypothetical protein L6452_25416 [Arctium lappa]